MSMERASPRRTLTMADDKQLITRQLIMAIIQQASTERALHMRTDQQTRIIKEGSSTEK
jgi:hypothetical protein